MDASIKSGKAVAIIVSPENGRGNMNASIESGQTAEIKNQKRALPLNLDKPASPVYNYICLICFNS